jgi:hypothetical protein
VPAYEPPDRVVFTWDISPAWEIETDLERASEVEVRFIAEADSRTPVKLEHRNLERHGDGWEGCTAPSARRVDDPRRSRGSRPASAADLSRPIASSVRRAARGPEGYRRQRCRTSIA